MRKLVIAVCGVSILGALSGGATYARYGNFDPCDWIIQDQFEQTSLPKIVLIGQLKAKLLVDGITSPQFSQCLLGWWESRADDARK